MLLRRWFCLLLFAGLPLAACSPIGMAVGAGAGAGVAASEERGLGGAIGDTTIRAEINYKFLNADVALFRRVSTSVHEGRVLLMGIVPNAEALDAATRLTWQVAGVKEVINELHVAPDAEILDTVRDGWIAAELRTRLLFDKEVLAINYSVEAVGRVIYVLGVAQDGRELDRVIRTARDIPYVEGVVSHVLLKDDPRRRAS